MTFFIGAVLAVVGGLAPVHCRGRTIQPSARVIPVVESPLGAVAQAA